MSASEARAAADHRRREERWMRAGAIATAGVIGLFWAASILGVAAPLLVTLFVVAAGVLSISVWVAAWRALPNLRLVALLGAIAATLQLIGTALWEGAYAANGDVIPDPPGYWTPFVHAALVFGLATAWAGVRGAFRLRALALDYSVVIAAGACVAWATVEPRFATGWSLTSLDAALRPLFAVFTSVLIVSAGLGRWHALPLPVGIFGVAQVINGVASSIFAAEVAAGTYDDPRWTEALSFTATALSLLAVALVIARVDRPIRRAADGIPSAGHRTLLGVTLAAWGASGGLVVLGALDDDDGALWLGLAATAWIGLTMASRHHMALASVRASNRRLNDALLAREEADDAARQLEAERDRANVELARRNAELESVQAMVAPLLDALDDRTDGALYAELERQGDDLLAWLTPRGGPD